jgi:hypothetical protein
VTRSTAVRTVAGDAGFVSPSGRIACLVDAEFVRCEFAGEKAWLSPVPDGCQLDWEGVFTLGDIAHPGCVGDTIRYMSALDSGDVAWWHPGDPTVMWYGTALAALPYGSSIVVSSFQCSSETTGVTCTNTDTGHGFSMSREAYSIF